jgi:ferredoxin-NADP reductase/DMSO/TMAO reductase YedYZ heme-binding membrane subunit
VKRILGSKWTRAGAFLLCLLPLTVLGWHAVKHELGANPIEFVTHATGDWTLRFLLITLAVTPIQKALSTPQLARFRRMLGLFAFFYGCLHLLTYLWLDKFFDFGEIVPDIRKRLFITAGFTGFALMVPLALTSTAGWVERLGLRRWQQLHRLIYISGLAGVIHYYWLVKSDVRLPVLYGAILTLLLAARLVGLRSGRSTTTTLRLLSIKRETKDTVTLRFPLSRSQRLSAKPGQFLTFDWIVNGKKLPRSYSISSSPLRTDYIEITVKEQGTVSRFLNRDARKGLRVEAHGPYGQFYFVEKEHRNVVMFAGGSGITPIMSMLRCIEKIAPDTDISLFYTFRTEQDLIFEEDLKELRKRLPRFSCVAVASRPGVEWQGERGHVNRALIEQHLGHISQDQTFFLCGPTGFMASIGEILIALGARSEQILQERFTIGTPVSMLEAPSPCTIAFAKSGRKYEGSSAETLLMIAEKHGIKIPYSCRVGQCGTCATRVLAGEVEMEADGGLDPELRAQGYRLLCVGHARGLVGLDA